MGQNCTSRQTTECDDKSQTVSNKKDVTKNEATHPTPPRSVTPTASVTKNNEKSSPPVKSVINIKDSGSNPKFSAKSRGGSNQTNAKSDTKLSGEKLTTGKPKGSFSQLKLERGPQVKIVVDQTRIMAQLKEKATMRDEMAKFGAGGKPTTKTQRTCTSAKSSTRVIINSPKSQAKSSTGNNNAHGSNATGTSSSTGPKQSTTDGKSAMSRASSQGFSVQSSSNLSDTSALSSHNSSSNSGNTK